MNGSTPVQMRTTPRRSALDSHVVRAAALVRFPWVRVFHHSGKEMPV